MTPADAPAHLLVVDRDERLRDLLRQYLKTQGFLVSAARDEDHAARLLSGLEFDLVLLDSGLPHAAALRDGLDTPVLCLSDKSTPAPAGIASMIKPFEPRALCKTIYEILDRHLPPIVPGPKIVRFGPFSFDIDKASLTHGGAPVHLTATETQLMRILATHAGKPIGRGDLVARLGREGLTAKARAVDVQITRLRRKVEDNPKNPRYLQTVRGAGYVLEIDDA